MENIVLTGELFESTSPGGEKHRIATAAMNDQMEVAVCIEDAKEPQKHVDYYVAQVQAANRTVKVCLPPPGSASHAVLVQLFGGVPDALQAMMRCNVDATFIAQAWINDNAIEVDDGRQVFNAMPQLIRMDLGDVIEMFEEDVDYDELAHSCPGFENNTGPFEVQIDEEDVVKMVYLLSDNANVLPDGRLADVTPAMWDDFCANAGAILKEVASASEREAPSQADLQRPVPKG